MLTALLLGTALAADPPVPTATVDAASGSSATDAWVVTLQAGYPWSTLRAQGGVVPRLTVFGEVDTALFRRIQPTVGVHALIVGGRIGRFGAEAGVGWQFQWGELPQFGPSAVVRLRASVTGGRITAYLVAATRHTFLPDRTRTIRADGEEVRWTVRHAWTPSGQLGLAVRITPMVGLEAGLGWRFADVGTYAFSLPTFHGGIHVGGLR